MLKRIYIIGGGFLVGGYLAWSALGMEFLSNTRDPMPRTKIFRSSSHSRSGFGYYGSGFGFGK